MRIVLAAAAISVSLVGAGWAQQEEPPPECRYDASGRIDYSACAAAAPSGSAWRTLSVINLGTQAFLRADYAAAIQYYDQAQPTYGNTFYFDATYHAYHAATLQAVGRPAEAIAEARRSLALVRNSEELPAEVRRRFGSTNVDVELVYAAILPVLHAANDPESASVRGAYLSIPAQDWVSWVNRGSVLDQIGDVSGALQANAEAMRLQPDHPAVLNNQCYFLGRANRASEALPYCERAVAAAPEVGAIRHSHATALAALGRCADAERALAAARRLDPATMEYQHPIACSPR